MAVSKKFLPRAVDRNRVKRVIRELSRETSRDPDRKLWLTEIRLLIRLTRKPSAAFSLTDRQCKHMLRTEIQAGLTRLSLRLSAGRLPA